MNKYFKNFFTILIFSFFIVGCNKYSFKNIRQPFKISKPSINLYTENLIRTIKNSKNIQVSIFYPKIGKNKVIPKDYMEKFNLFLDSIKPNYFIKSNIQDLNLQNPEYRLTVFVNNAETFIINIFNSQYITIHPWDGKYTADIINISNLQDGINLYNIVDFIIKNKI